MKHAATVQCTSELALSSHMLQGNRHVRCRCVSSGVNHTTLAILQLNSNSRVWSIPTHRPPCILIATSCIPVATAYKNYGEELKNRDVL